jgi:hypothetical protein
VAFALGQAQAQLFAVGPILLPLFYLWLWIFYFFDDTCGCGLDLISQTACTAYNMKDEVIQLYFINRMGRRRLLVITLVGHPPARCLHRRVPRRLRCPEVEVSPPFGCAAARRRGWPRTWGWLGG